LSWAAWSGHAKVIMMAITIGITTKMDGTIALNAMSIATERWSPLMSNDMQIKHDVLAALDREQNVVAGSIGVEVHHGVVKLAGRVDDNAIKEGAGRAAERVDDVTAVVLDIDVARVGAVGPSAIV
jgi:osmotically-inducible protein OsmY